MVTCFVDDSGNPADCPAFVLAGFFTTDKHWGKIMKEWLGMVHRFKVNRFHAVDCAHGSGEFRGWSQRRKKSMFRNLIKILTRHSDLHGCSAAIVIKDYEDVVPSEADRVFGGPKQLALQLLLLDVSKIARQPVRFVVDKPSKGWGELDDIFAKTQRLAKLRPWADCLVSLNSGNVRTCPELQTADLLAYECYRELAQKEKAKTGPRRRMRKSLSDMVTGKRSISAPYLERNSLQRLIEECRKDGKI